MCRLVITDRDREGCYKRQTTLPHIGKQGRERLAAATVVVVGCGELGTVAAKLLAQAGVGCLHLVDDEYVEAVNIDAQVFLEQEDARVKYPRVLIAAEQLRAVNSTVRVEPVVTRLTSANADRLLRDADLILDGTDNDATRHVLNQVCMKQNIPWIFATVADSHGLTMNIVPGETPCFACVFGNPDGTRSSQGLSEQSKELLPTITHIVASLQVGQAIKLLLGDENYSRDLLYIDAWDPLLKRVVLKAQQGDCRVCGR